MQALRLGCRSELSAGTRLWAIRQGRCTMCANFNENVSLYITEDTQFVSFILGLHPWLISLTVDKVTKLCFYTNLKDVSHRSLSTLHPPHPSENYLHPAKLQTQPQNSQSPTHLAWLVMPPPNERHAFQSPDQSVPQFPEAWLEMRPVAAKLPEMFVGRNRMSWVWEAVCVESRGSKQGEDDGKGVWGEDGKECW